MRSVVVLLFMLYNNFSFSQKIVTEPVKELGLGTVWQTAVSPDGQTVAFAGGRIYLFDAKTKELIRVFEGHTDTIHDIAFSHDGNYLATGSNDWTAKLWDVKTGREVFSTQLEWDVQVVFSSHDTYLMATDFFTTKIIHVASQKIVAEFVDAWGLDISPDERKVLHISGREGEKVVTRDIATGRIVDEHTDSGFVSYGRLIKGGKRMVLHVHPGFVDISDLETGEFINNYAVYPSENPNARGIYNFVISPDETVLVTSFGGYPSAQVWDLESGKMRHDLKGHFSTIPPNSIRFSSDSSQIVTLDGASARFWDTKTGQLIKVWDPFSHYNTTAYAPDGKTFIAGGSSPVASLWDAETFQVLHTFSVQDTGVGGFAYSPDSSLVALASWDDRAYIYNVATGALLQTLTLNDNINSIDFSPDGTKVVTANQDGTAIIWNVGTGEKIKTFNQEEILGEVDFSPDGSLIATSSIGKIARIWGVTTGNLVHELNKHTNSVYFIEFSPDGKSLLTSGADGALMLWDVQSGQLKKVYSKPLVSPNGDASFSPDGNYIAWAVPGTEIHLIKLDTDEVVRVFKVKNIGDNSGFTTDSVKFSPDGRYLLTGNRDGIARIWDTGLYAAVGDWDVY